MIYSILLVASSLVFGCHAVEKISLRCVRTTNTLLNDPDQVAAIGTSYIVLEDLYDPHTNKKVGTASTVGTSLEQIQDPNTGANLMVAQVVFIVSLPNGQIHGSYHFTRQSNNPGVFHHLAIIGGTGDYCTARGQGSLEQPESDNDRLRFTILRS